MSPPRPFWREPMVWLVGGLPLAAVAASFALLVSAIRSSADDEVIEERAQSAPLPVARQGAAARAAQLNLSAVLHVQGDRVEVLPVTGTFDPKATLQLQIEYPTHAVAALRAQLLPSALGWGGQGVPNDSTDLLLKLVAADGSWELRGRLLRGQQAVLLQPALPGQ